MVNVQRRRGAFFVAGDDLSESELRATVLDGEVVVLAGIFVPIDAPVSARTRAMALGAHLTDARVMISDLSAAWVWGWGAQPAVVTTCVSILARIPSPERRRLHSREVVIADDERLTMGGVGVTSPERTMLDLARHAPDDHVIALLAAAIRAEGFVESDLERLLRRRPSLSFVHGARRRLWAALCRAETPAGQ